jgi:ABC-type bacteriocin/lantibiotic exporter with double-glycine peptidase domain
MRRVTTMETKKTKNLLSPLKFAKNDFLVIIVSGVLVDLLVVSFPLMMQATLDAISRKEVVDSASSNLALLAVIIVLTFILTIVRDLLAARFAANLDKKLSESIFDCALNVPFSKFRESMSGDWLVSMQLVQELKSQIGMLAIQALFSFFLIVFYVLVLFRYDTTVGAIYFGLSVLMIAAFSVASKAMFENVNEAYQLKSRSDSIFAEAIRYPHIVRTGFNVQKWLKTTWTEIYASVVKKFQKSDIIASLSTSFSDIARQSAPIAILFWKIPQVESGAISIGSVVAISLVFGQGFDPMTRVAALLSNIQRVRVGLRQVSKTDQLLDLHTELAERPLLVKAINGEHLVEMSDVSFSYDSICRPVGKGSAALKNVDFAVKKNERIAIVGCSGSGKSTLLNLLARLYEPASGSIFIDNRLLSNWQLGELQKKVGYLGQQPSLLSGTVFENVACGAMDSDISNVQRCLETANLLHVIEKLPLGLLTAVGDGSTLLSVGEVQRLALARVLFSNPELLLLDEPTSALDPASEQEFLNSLFKMPRTQTVIMVTHNFDILPLFDRVYVLDRGEISGVGSHDDLFRNSPAFRQLSRAANQLALDNN